MSLKTAFRFGALSVLASVALAGALPESAHAYCRSHTIGRGYSEETGACRDEGKPLFWRSRCIGYQVYPKIRHYSEVLVNDVLARSFAKWTQSSCVTDREHGDTRVSLDVRYLGLTNCPAAGDVAGKGGEGQPPLAPDEIKFNRTGPNQNAIVFRDDNWRYTPADQAAIRDSGTLGLTTVTFIASTGEILDADVEFNTFEASRDEGTVTSSGFDFESIVTHELGHFLGIAHSEVEDSTMYASYQAGETTKRYLKLDDVEAICAAYRPDGVRSTSATGEVIMATTCDPTPRGGIQRECIEPEAGCAASPGSHATRAPTALVLLAVALGAAVARRARAGRA